MGEQSNDDVEYHKKPSLVAIFGVILVLLNEFSGRGLFLIASVVLEQALFWQLLFFVLLLISIVLLIFHLISRFSSRVDNLFGKIVGLALTLWLFVFILVMMAVWYKRWLTP